MSRSSMSFGRVIAERRLHPRGEPRRSVVVSLGTPRQTKGSGDWECPFRISGSGLRRVAYGRGVDAFQALTMALEGIRHFLDQMDTPLVWGGTLDDHTGFQRIVPLLAGPGGFARSTARMERVVDRELLRRLQELKRRHRTAQGRKGRGAPKTAPTHRAEPRGGTSRA